MSEAIKKSDLIQGSPFEEIGREISATLGILERFDAEVKSIAKTMNGELSTAQKKTVQDINAINQAEIESEKLMQQKLRTQKMQLDLVKKQEQISQQAQRQAEKEARATASQIRAQEKLNSVYSRVDQKLSGMVKTYRDLAIRKELGAKLTDQEQKNYDYLQQKIQKYDNALKTVDATMGKHQRNVGNYKSAYDGLGFSFAQLTREAPAFANSMQTGFMAISNNLPMFFDEISKIKKANIDLAASGQPVQSVFGQIAKSVFSFQTLLSVGVTLLTLYGSQLVDFFSKMFNVNKEQERQINLQKIINKDRKESAKFIADESSELIGNINALRKTNAGSAERAKMIKLINSTHGTTIKNLKDEAYFQEQLNNQVQSFLEKKIAEYKSKKNETLINMNLQKQDKLRASIKDQEERVKIAQRNYDIDVKIQALQEKKLKAGGRNSAERQNIKDIEAQQLALQKQKVFLEKEGDNGFLLRKSSTLKEEQEALSALNNELTGTIKRSFTYDVIVKEDTKLTGENTESKKELNTQLEQTNEYLRIQAQLLHEIAQLRYTEQITALERQFKDELKIQEDSAEKLGTFTLDKLYSLLDEKAKIQKEALKEQENYELTQLATKYQNETNAEYKALEDRKTKLLSQEGLTTAQKLDIENQYQADKKVIEANDIKRIADYDLQVELMQKKSGDESVAIDLEVADKKAEISDNLTDKKKENNEKATEDDKKKAKEAYDFMVSIQEAITQMLKEQVDRRISLLQLESEAAKKQQDYLQNLAANGNIYAQQSITEQIQIQREAQAEQMRLEKQKQSIELISTGLKTFESALADGKTPGEALASTIVNTTVLTSFLKNLQFYEKGTMNAPGGLSIVDEKGSEMITDKFGNIKEIGGGKGARFTMLDRGDKVYTANQTASMLSAFDNYGNATKMGGMDKAGTSFDLMNMTKEIKVLQSIVANKSESNVSWESFASGISEIVQVRQSNGVISKNRFRVN